MRVRILLRVQLENEETASLGVLAKTKGMRKRQRKLRVDDDALKMLFSEI